MKWIVMTGLLLLVNQVDVSEPLSINLPDQTIFINRENFTLKGLPIVDSDKFNELLTNLNNQLYKAPRNAKLNESGKMVPELQGQRLDHMRFTEQFYTYFYGTGATVIEAPRISIPPEVDSELLAHISQKQVGQYVTYFNMGNKGRSYNISLAAEAINNIIIFPGETFSFNRVVGRRTKDRGYLEAPIIVRGELSEGIGGGICQVSSTLFNAADSAGLQITQRYSHSKSVPYVLPGRDATVSWYGPDFSFQNQYNQPVLIRATAAQGIMYVTIYSSEVIEHKPREIPSMSRQLPEEIPQNSLDQ